MERFTYAVVLITASSSEEADKIALALLEKRRAACVNIVPGLKSFFWWQGNIDRAGEFLLVIKTKASAVPGVIQTVKELHGYTVPEIIALPVIEGSCDYLNWIDSEVRD